jgi:hypothetical protein
MGLVGARAEASEALQTQINAAVMVNTLVIVRPLNAVPTDRMTIRVAERAWVYTMKSLDRFPRGFIPQGEHQCARNYLFEESS